MSRKAKEVDDRYKQYRMSRNIFLYKLTAEQFTVYSYLVSCAGAEGMCWPSMKTIAEACGLCKNTVRKTIDVLIARKFIRKVQTEREDAGGHTLHGNNHYYILELPDVLEVLRAVTNQPDGSDTATAG